MIDNKLIITSQIKQSQAKTIKSYLSVKRTYPKLNTLCTQVILFPCGISKNGIFTKNRKNKSMKRKMALEHRQRFIAFYPFQIPKS